MTGQDFPIGIAEPGTQFGPCADPCDCVHCATMKQHANAECPFCDGEIGYNRPFFTDGANNCYHTYNCTNMSAEADEYFGVAAT